jgi:Flp pilus assembly protein TadG
MTTSLDNAFQRPMDESARLSAKFLRSVLQRNRPSSMSPGRSTDAAEGEAGQALIELAITIPVLFLFLFAFMQVCMICYTRNMISEAARQGTEYAAVRSGPYGASTGCMTTNYSTSVSCAASATQVQSYVTGIGWPNIAGGTMTAAVSYIEPTGGLGPGNVVGNYVKVTVNYAFPISVPFMPHSTLTLTSSSQMTIVH